MATSPTIFPLAIFDSPAPFPVKTPVVIVMLPLTVKLLVISKSPTILAPTPVTTNILALPATLVVTLPFASTITLLLPLLILDTLAPGANTPLPYNTFDELPSKFARATLPSPVTFAAIISALSDYVKEK